MDSQIANNSTLNADTTPTITLNESVAINIDNETTNQSPPTSRKSSSSLEFLRNISSTSMNNLTGIVSKAASTVTGDKIKVEQRAINGEDAKAISHALLTDKNFNDGAGIPFDLHAPRNKWNLPSKVRTFGEFGAVISKNMVEQPAGLISSIISGTYSLASSAYQHFMKKDQTNENNEIQEVQSEVEEDIAGKAFETLNTVLGDEGWAQLPSVQKGIFSVYTAKRQAENAIRDQTDTLAPLIEEINGSAIDKVKKFPFQSIPSASMIAEELAKAGTSQSNDIESGNSREHLDEESAKNIEETLDIHGSLTWRAADTVARLLEKIPGQKQGNLTEEELSNIIESKKTPPFKRPFDFALLRAGEMDHTTSIGSFEHKMKLPLEVHTPDKTVKAFFAALLDESEALPFKKKEANTLTPEAGSNEQQYEDAIVTIDIRGENFKENVFDPFMEEMKVKEIQLKGDDKPTAGLKAPLWGFVQAVDEGRLKERGTKVLNDLDELAIKHMFKIKVDEKNPEIEERLNKRLKSEDFKPARVRLALLEIMKQRYVDAANITKACGDCTTGAVWGTLGELAIDKVLPSPEGGVKEIMKSGSYYANIGLGAGADVVDNISGRGADVDTEIAGRGIGLNSKEAENLRKNANRAGYFGAALGAVSAIGVMLPMSAKNSPTWLRQICTIPWAISASLSIPTDFAMELVETMAAINEQTKDLYDIPKEGVKDAETWIRDEAIQDIMSRVGKQASAKAFSSVSALAIPWSGEYVNKAARSGIQDAEFGMAPGIENIFSSVFMSHIAGSAKDNFDQAKLSILTKFNTSKKEGLSLPPNSQQDDIVQATEVENLEIISVDPLAPTSPNQAPSENEKKIDFDFTKHFRNTFSGPWSQGAAKTMNAMTYHTIQRHMGMDRRKIDFVDTPGKELREIAIANRTQGSLSR